MGATLTASFATRREAEMTIERLVQEFGVERTDVFVSAEGDANSAGDTEAGADTEAASPTPPSRDDAALAGQIIVSVDIEDDKKIAQVRQAFAEFEATTVEES